MHSSLCITHAYTCSSLCFIVPTDISIATSTYWKLCQCRCFKIDLKKNVIGCGSEKKMMSLAKKRDHTECSETMTMYNYMLGVTDSNKVCTPKLVYHP